MLIRNYCKSPFYWKINSLFRKFSIFPFAREQSRYSKIDSTQTSRQRRGIKKETIDMIHQSCQQIWLWGQSSNDSCNSREFNFGRLSSISLKLLSLPLSPRVILALRNADKRRDRIASILRVMVQYAFKFHFIRHFIRRMGKKSKLAEIKSEENGNFEWKLL